MPRARAVRRKSSGRRLRKDRITVSLSRDKVRFLKAHSEQAGVASVSAFVERLIGDAQARAELEKLGAHTALYYDSLSAAESEEQRVWGELGELGLAPAEE